MRGGGAEFFKGPLLAETPAALQGPPLNEFVVATNKPAEKINQSFEGRVIGGLPLKKFYPELADAMLFCATEMTQRAEMDTVAEAFSK